MKRRLYSIPALVILAFLAFLFVRGTYIVFKKKSNSGNSVVQLEAKVAALREKQAELTANIEGLRSGEGIEKEVKQKYNVAREGEYVVILIDEEATTTEVVAEDKPWWRRAWDGILSAL